MIELEEAREKMTQHMKSQCETEEVALLDSLGRISGETIFAETAIPHFPRAGMDGYAVRAVETRGATAESPSCLKVVGSLVAGDSMFYCNQTNNCAIKITTGAFIPTILGMDLSAGGHLTHGSPVNFSGKTYNFVSYGVDPSTEVIDYDVVRILAREHRPKLIVAGASAYSRTIDFKRFREIADEVDAKLMVDMAHIAGLVASGLHPNPVPYADIVTSTTHKTLRGPRGGLILTNSEELAKKVNSSIFPGIQGGPLEHVIAGKAAAFKEALDPSFAEYSQQVIANAQAMTKVFNQAPEARLISGATDNHLLLIEVTGFGLNGKEAEAILDSVNITVNKNSIPFEQLSPFKTSGIRIGTPAITSRGFKEEDAVEVAKLIVQVLKDPENTAVHDEVKAAVAALTKKYPLYN